MQRPVSAKQVSSAQGYSQPQSIKRPATADLLNFLKEDVQTLQVSLQHSRAEAARLREEVQQFKRFGDTMHENALRAAREWTAINSTNEQLIALLRTTLEKLSPADRGPIELNYNILREKFNQDAATRKISEEQRIAALNSVAPYREAPGLVSHEYTLSDSGAITAGKRVRLETGSEAAEPVFAVQPHAAAGTSQFVTMSESPLSAITTLPLSFSAPSMLSGSAFVPTAAAQSALAPATATSTAAALASSATASLVDALSRTQPSVSSAAAAAAGSAPAPPSLVPSVPPATATYSKTAPPSSYAAERPSASNDKIVPRTAQHLAPIRCPDIVSSVAFSLNDDNLIAYTGVKSKLMGYRVSKPDESVIDFQCDDAGATGYYLRAIRPMSDNRTVVVGGESRVITVIDVEKQQPMSTLSGEAPNVYSITSGLNNPNLFITCGSTGAVTLWDIRQSVSARSFVGHKSAATCSDCIMDADGRGKLYTGSLDNSVNYWDIAEGKGISRFRFAAPVYALALKQDDPKDMYLAVGLDTDKLLVINLETTHQWELLFHQSAILSLKYARRGGWFMSTGKDRAVVAWKAPRGPSIFKAAEPNSVLCCDISSSEKYFVTGSGSRAANIYKLDYAA